MITSPISRPITSRIASAIAGAVAAAGRWYLHWGGVNEYAVHSAWAMSGFGDRIEFSFVADDPGNQNQRVISGASVDGKHELFMLNATAVCYWVYRDTTGAYQAIVGPTAIAGTLYICTVSYNADGVIFTVNGTEYVNSAVPQLSAEFTNISSVVGGGGVLDGTIHYLRYVNATALQGVNAVQGNGVDLYGVIPEITLTGDFEIELDHISALYSAANYRIIGSNASNSLRYSTASSGQLAITISGVSGAIDDVLPSVAGEHGRLIVSRTAGQVSASWCGVPGNNTLSIPGDFVISKIYTADSVPLPAGAVLGNLKITDKSGASDVVYQYDLSGDDGSDIPITIDGVASTPGTWQNYDSGTDQVALPVLSRNYRMKDGPDALFLEDANHPLGPELVTNGGFDSDVSGWSLSSGTGPTWDAGELTAAAASSGLEVKPGQAVATEIGKQYSVVFEARVASGDLFYAAAGTYLGGLDVSGWVVAGATPTTNTQYAYVFTAVGTTTYLTFMGYNAGSIAEVWLDNVSVKCIETGAVLYNVDPEDWDRSKS